MELPDDLRAYLAATFAPTDRAQAAQLLAGARGADGSSPGARLLRCAAVAADGELARLRHWVAQMALDWRDVVVGGECVQRGGGAFHALDLHLPIATPGASQTLYKALAALAGAGALDDWHSVRRLALAWVSALPLSGAQQRWLAQGKAFAAGHIDSAALEDTRVEAWDSIDGREDDEGDPEVQRVRAVLCVLYPDDEMQDAQLYLETLLGFYLGARGDTALALRALRELVV